MKFTIIRKDKITLVEVNQFESREFDSVAEIEFAIDMANDSSDKYHFELGKEIKNEND